MKKTAAFIFLCAFAPALALATDAWVERTLRSMSVDEKIGQMLMARSGPEAFRATDSRELEAVRRAIREFHVGSVHAGVGDTASVAVRLDELQRLAKVPLLTVANLEAGAGYVLYGATRMPMAMAIAATGDEQLAYEVARVSAEEGRAAGIHVNFFPVADVNNNPDNPIINIRSFGEDPASVSRFVAAYVRGAQEHGQIATLKHFPGHGDVAVDSHLEMPTLDVTRARLDAVELPPFRAAIDAGAGAVMTAHIWLPRLDPEQGIPATLSKPVLSDLLREDLGFEGVIFTDSLGMHAVSKNFSTEEVAIRAVEAGNDILLTPPDLEGTFRVLQQAVKSGRISEERLDQSVRRILEAKSRLGLDDPANRFVASKRLMESIGTTRNRELAERIAERAMTLVKDERSTLPLRPSPDLRVLQINILDTRSGWREGPVGRVVATELAKRFPRAATVHVDDQTPPAEIDLVRKLASMADALIVNGFVRVASYKGSIDLGARQTALLREILAMKKPLVFTAFGNPYQLRAIPDLPAYAVTYDTSPAAERATIRAITGEIAFEGRLPVRIGEYPIGHGIAGVSSE